MYCTSALSMYSAIRPSCLRISCSFASKINVSAYCISPSPSRPNKPAVYTHTLLWRCPLVSDVASFGGGSGAVFL